MNQRAKFGYDFLYIMRGIQISGEKEKDSKVDTATQIFLVFWNFTLEEIKEVNDVFIGDVERGNLPDVTESFDNLTNYAKNAGQFYMNLLLIQSAAIAFFDNKFDSGEANIIKIIADRLDLRPSEIDNLVKTGTELAMGLHVFGKVYARQQS